MSQESSTPPFQHGRGTASSSPSFLQSKENIHGREVVGDNKEEQHEKFNEQSEEQEASKEEEPEAEEDREEEKAKSLPKTVEQRPSAINRESSERKKMKMKEKVLAGDDDGGIPRLSSDKDDEFAILSGILDYYSKNGVYPFVNTNPLHDFIESSLNANVTVGELIGKIEEFRKKYEKIVGEKGEKWGAGIGIKNGDDENKLNGEEKKNLEVGEEVDMCMYPFLKESFEFVINMNASMAVLRERRVKEGLALMGSSKMEELDGKWQKLLVDQIEIYMKGMDLIREQTKLVLRLH